jgi:cation:H+ antiporter
LSLILTIITLVFGFALLIAGAYFLVTGASSLAKRLEISEMAIGLTVVAFGTSTPELIINLFASAQGFSEIVFGNIIGSNIFNILLILGIAGALSPLMVHSNTVRKEIPFSLLAIVLLFILVNDTLFRAVDQSKLSLIDGIILLGLFVIFLVYVFGISKIKDSGSPQVKEHNWLLTILLIIASFAGLFLGGRIVVSSSISMARFLSVSENLIALTIVAGGTSLPELATSAVAAYRKRDDIAIGNILGSNIFNICFVLGISSVIKPAQYDPILNMDLMVLFAATIVLFMTMFTGTRRRLDRWEAIVFMICYIGHIYFLLHRK